MIPDKKKAIFYAKKQLTTIIYDTVNLEGINYSLPEVQTLLDGVTVGGHKISDQTITLNQAASWNLLFDLVNKDQFIVNKITACVLHDVAAREEALTWGKFRDSGVNISGTKTYKPPKAEFLDNIWLILENDFTTVSEDKYKQAIYLFLQMARIQFFYDVNKRTGRLMMNGYLLTNGLPIINVPFAKQLEYNSLLLDFYETNNVKPMTDFMMSLITYW